MIFHVVRGRDKRTKNSPSHSVSPMIVAFGLHVKHSQFPPGLDHTPHIFFKGTPPPFWITPSFWRKFKKLPLLSESHPNWCMQIAWNTLKWRTYISYYTKSIEDIVIITLYRFWLNSVFTADSLVTYFLWCFSYLIC